MFGIKEIEIHNIRSLRNKITLSFDDRNLIVLIGKNNHGKTSILKAIDFFFSRDKKFPSLWPKDRNGNFLSLKEIKEDPSVTITFILDDEGKDKTIKILSEEKHDQVFLESLVNLSNGAYEVAIRRALVMDKKGEIKAKGYEIKKGSKFNSFTGWSSEELPEHFFLPSIASVEDYQEAGKRATASFQDLFEIYLEGKGIDEVEEIKQNVEELRKSILRELKFEGIEEKLKAYSCEIFQDIEEVEIDSFFRGAKDLSTLLKKVSITIGDGVKGDISEKGSGVQRIIIIGLLRLIGEEINLQSSNEAIFLLDEPEIHLHPEAQKQLKLSLEKIARKHKVIVATHSHLMIGKKFGVSNIKLATKERNIITIRDVEKDAEFFRLLFEYLGFVPSDFLIPDNFILVEGDYDKRFLDRIVELICRSKDNEWRKHKDLFGRYQVSALPIGGIGRTKSALDFIANPEEALAFFQSIPSYKNRFTALFDSKNDGWLIGKRRQVNDMKKPYRVNCLKKNGIEFYYPQDLVKIFASQNGDRITDTEKYITAKLSSPKEEKERFKRDLSNFVIGKINLNGLNHIDSLILDTMFNAYSNCEKLV